MENNTLNSYIKEDFKYFKDDKLEINEIFNFKDDKTKEKFEMFFNGVIYALKNLNYGELSEIYDKSIEKKDTNQDRTESYIDYLNNELKNRRLNKETKKLYKDLLMTLEADLKRYNANLDDSIINKLFKNKYISISYYSLIVPYNIANEIEFNKNYYSFLELEDFTKFIIFPYYQLLYLSKDNLRNIYIKNTDINLHDYFINIIKDYIKNLIDNKDVDTLKELLDVLTNEHEYLRSPKYTDYRKGNGRNLFELLIDMNFNEFKDILYEVIYIVMNNNLKKELQIEMNYDIYKHNIFLISLMNDEVDSHRQTKFNDKFLIENNNTIRATASADLYSKNNYYQNNLLGHYINDLYVNKNKINKFKRVNKVRSFKSFIYLTNQRCIIGAESYYKKIYKYLFDPSNLTREEFEVATLLIKLITCKTSNQLKRVMEQSKVNSVLNNLLSKEEVNNIIKIGIEMNINTIFNEKGVSKIDTVDLTVGNIVKPLLYNNANDYEEQTEIINSIFKNFTYDIDINFDRYHYKDLDEYFETRLNLGLLKESNIDIGININYNKIAKTIVNNIKDKLRGRYDFEKNEFIITYDKMNITRLTSTEFCNGLCEYLSKYFPEEAKKLNKSFRAEIVNTMFR
ncbi:hypothetical protein CPT_Madawaska_258 [Staphylococcus phage Madawaska]|nr:hypothetical protein CPT_Madawaska_258 [Staphylococcus phage Madawaska]